MKRILTFVKHIKWWQLILVVFIGSFLYFGYLFITRSSFSASDILISVEGPATFRAQEQVLFEIKVQNQSDFALREGVLFITLPEFMAFENDASLEKRIEFDAIMPYGGISESIQVFAKETQRQGIIKARIEYMPENLAGTFERTAVMDVSVSSLPLTVIFDLPQKAVNGQQIRGSFHFVAEKEMESLPLIAKIVLPDGVTFLDAEPASDPKEEATWEFDKVEVQKSYQVEFEGKIEGFEGETKEFALVFGGENDEGRFIGQYTVSREVRISLAPLDFNQRVNGETKYIATDGERLDFSVHYNNKSGADIEDITITVELTGEMFDLATVNPGVGYFNRRTDTIIWNKNFSSTFARLQDGEGGVAHFSVVVKEGVKPSGNKSGGIYGVSKATIEVGKVPLALKGLSLRAEHEAKVQLRTSLDLVARGYYYHGQFSNSGPIPPQVGNKTTYTIVWQVTNSVNEADDVQVEASLPKDVTFEGNVYPKGSNFTYNSAAHVVVWDIGSLAAGVGSVLPDETVAFQVSITPTEEMRGTTVTLIEESKINGKDSLTNDLLQDLANVIDTRLLDDLGMREGDAVVQ